MRRRKPRVVWIPTTPEFSVDATGLSSWNFAFVQGLNTTAADTVALEVPVVLDGTQSDPLDATSSLSDIENSGYRLRRIVGKIWVSVSTEPADTFATIGITAGFIIRRVDPGTGGSLAGAISQANVNPATIQNSMDPWIWRRSWLVNTGPTFASQITGQPTADQASRIQARMPSNNERGLSALDGPHIDQKTARIIGPEERLFLDVSATTLVVAGVFGDSNAQLSVLYETRVLGSMRTSSGNRRNASR